MKIKSYVIVSCLLAGIPLKADYKVLTKFLIVARTVPVLILLKMTKKVEKQEQKAFFEKGVKK